MRIGRTRRAGGFTYVGLLVLLAILGLVGAAGLKMGTVLQRAAAEDELLDIGAAFSDALASYAAATPKGQLTQPPTLQELLKDPRFPGTRRHLRKIFVDPITGKSEWGLVRLGDKDSGGIIGVYSLSTSKPLKISNFDARFDGFDNRQHLSEWRFMATGQAAAPPPGLVPPGGQVPPAGQLQPGQAGATNQIAPGQAAPEQAPLIPVDPNGTPAVPPVAPQQPPEPPADPAPAPEPAAVPERGAAPVDPPEAKDVAAPEADGNAPADPPPPRR